MRLHRTRTVDQEGDRSVNISGLSLRFENISLARITDDLCESRGVDEAVFETKNPITDKERSPLIGIYNKTAYYLLYNGILGDKSVSGGNVLTTKTLDALPKYNGKKVIYGETTRLSSLRLEENQITFKQTPYDIKAR